MMNSEHTTKDPLSQIFVRSGLCGHRLPHLVRIIRCIHSQAYEVYSILQK